MLNQSFAVENLRKIYDYENRKGNNLSKKFFPSIASIDEELRKLKEQNPRPSRSDYEEQKNKIKERKEEELAKELKALNQQIIDKEFYIELKKIDIPLKKPAYSVKDNPSAYFAMKQIQYNFRKLYKVKQASRHDIISQLITVLNNDFPKYLIRTDIHSFFESIPRNKILSKIEQDPLLTYPSKRIIKQILYQYGKLSREVIGIPRGVGISAYLSELYMRSFDEAIRHHPDVAYYARYVDDIIVVFYPKSKSGIPGYYKFIKKEAESLKLKLNDGKNGRSNKTKQINLSETINECNKCFEYLGYRIELERNEKIKLHMSDKKVERYKGRIDSAFKQYFRHKNRDKILINRILFLYGNTRLVGNKENILVGIYYSNRFLSADSPSLKCLDEHLTSKIDELENDKLKCCLKKNSFQKGFTQRKFIKFKSNKLNEIIKIWKYET